jgi:hypothetical protein
MSSFEVRGEKLDYNDSLRRYNGFFPQIPGRLFKLATLMKFFLTGLQIFHESK